MSDQPLGLGRDRTVVSEAAFLARAKHGTTVSVCLPARNEESTVAAIVEPIAHLLRDQAGFVDEIIVMDHASTDGTARAARAAGARVVDCDAIMPAFGPALGKGDVLWRSLFASTGDLIVWLDADLASFTPEHVTALARPFLTDARVGMVRGTPERSLDGVVGEGGRVTELTARPALELLVPELAHIRQPLGGEYAVRRSVAEAVPFEVDYGVEMGLLIDISRRFGVSSIEQVDLPVRIHRQRPLSELSVQARQVLRAVLSRSGPHSERLDSPLRPPARAARIHAATRGTAS